MAKNFRGYFFAAHCRLGVVRAAVGVACYLAVLFRRCTCYRPAREYFMYCNDAFLERIKNAVDAKQLIFVSFSSCSGVELKNIISGGELT